MKKRIIALLLSILMLFTLAACGSTAGSSAAPASSTTTQSTQASGSSGGKTVYTIAMATALTDFMAEVGTEFLHSVEMACEEVNAENAELGLDWELAVEAFDEKCDVTEATLVAQRIAESADKYVCVFGHLFSSTTLACIKTYNDAGLPLFVPTANSDDIVSDNMLRMCLPASIQGPQVAACALNNCGGTRIALIYAMSDFGIGMANQLTAIAADKGAEIVASETYTAGTDKDFSAILTKVEKAQADCVIIIGDYNEGSMIIDQAGHINYFNDNNIPFVSDATMFSDTFLERVSGSGIEDQIFLAAAYNPYSTDENYQKFNNKFFSTYGINTTEPVVYGYDMTHIVAQALREGANRDNLVATVKGMTFNNLVSVSGDIQFNADGNRSFANISVIGVKDGAFIDTGDTVDMTGIKY